jgi:hypothetical protein
METHELAHVLWFLKDDPRSLCSAAAVCRRWYVAARDPSLWREATVRIEGWSKLEKARTGAHSYLRNARSVLFVCEASDASSAAAADANWPEWPLVELTVRGSIGILELIGAMRRYGETLRVLRAPGCWAPAERALVATDILCNIRGSEMRLPRKVHGPPLGSMCLEQIEFGFAEGAPSAISSTFATTILLYSASTLKCAMLASCCVDCEFVRRILERCPEMATLEMNACYSIAADELRDAASSVPGWHADEIVTDCFGINKARIVRRAIPRPF